MPLRAHITGLSFALVAACVAVGCAGPQEAADSAATRERWLPPDAGLPLSEPTFDDLDYVDDGLAADAGLELGPDTPSSASASAAFTHVSHDPFARVDSRVDLASYASFARGAAYAVLPPREAVHVESFVNAFDYDYAAPAADAEHPFHVQLDLADHPLGRMANLLRVSLRAASPAGELDARVVAEDVEIVVEMNPSWVAAYRLVGFIGTEGDAGEVEEDSGEPIDLVAGQKLTALLELIPKGYPVPDPEGAPSPLSGPAVEGKRAVEYGEIARVSVQYRRPDTGTRARPCAAAVDTTEMVQEPLAMDDDFLWAAAIAGLAERLADSPYAGAGERAVIADLLERAAGDDPAREELLYAFHKIEAQLDP